MTFSRWKQLMSHFGFEENRSTFESIISHYSEKHRVYHTIKHISDCLEKLDLLTRDIDSAKEIELAIWFHDIVYNPYGEDNELKSAAIATAFLEEQGADANLKSTIRDLILATKHTELGKTEAQKILKDIDISILGTSPDYYHDYVAKIRKEFKLVPRFIYQKKRIKILIGFLEREPLFQTSPFYEMFEQKAKRNIRAEIEKYS